VRADRKWLFLIPAVLAVSWAAIIIRACQAPSTAIAFYRILIAVIILTPIALTKFRHEFSAFTKRTSIITLLSGFVLGWHFYFWIASLDYTSIASSVVLVTTQPIFLVAFTSIFLGEKPGFRGYIGIGLAIAGTVLIAGFDLKLSGDYLYGDFLAILGAIMAAAYLFFGRIVRSTLNIIPYIYVVYSTAAFTLGVILLVTGQLFAAYKPMDYFYFGLLAIGPTLIGHSLYNYMVKHIKAYKVGISIVAEPVLASIWAIFIFKEIPNIGTITGGVLIILALILVFSERD